MSDQTFFINRAVLSSVFGDPRAVMQFEAMQERVAETSDTVTANLADTGKLVDATFVTLSSNAELPNERVLVLGDGLCFDLSEPGQVKLTPDVATNGGWGVTFTVTGQTNLALPLGGIVATTGNTETLSKKTLAAPKLSGLGNYADDTAAAAGGVPIGGVYHDAGNLRVRIA